jgi:hypothetical protein
VTQRIRMARKRLGIARERFGVALRQCCASRVTSQRIWRRVVSRWDTLRAIERRKERISWRAPPPPTRPEVRRSSDAISI